MAGNWSDERVESLKKYFAEGLSASQIARRLGGFGHCTDGGRSSVIGKLLRLGLQRSTDGGHQARRAGGRQSLRKINRPAAARLGGDGVDEAGDSGGAQARTRRLMATPKVMPGGSVDPGYLSTFERQAVEAAEREAQGDFKMADAIGERECRFVLGEPARRMMCGHQAVPGTPYCDTHLRRCLTIPTVDRPLVYPSYGPRVKTRETENV